MEIKKKLLRQNRNLNKLLFNNFLKDFINNENSSPLIHCYSLLIIKIHSLTDSICLLASYDRGEESQILVRSLLETNNLLLLLIKYPFAEIANLIYFYSIHYGYTNMSKPFIAKRLSTNQEYISLMRKHKNLEPKYKKALEIYSQRRKFLFGNTKFSEDGYLGLNNQQISKLVGTADLYDQIYWQLSALTHPNVQGMPTRMEDLGDKYRLLAGKTKQETFTALFYALDINLRLLKSFYKNNRISEKYKKERDALEQELLQQPK